MKTRIISLFTVLMLIATMLTTNVFAEVLPLTVTLETIADTYVGDPIIIKGTVSDTSIPEVIIRILRPDGAMYEHTKISVNQFNAGYSLPTSSNISVTPYGIYTIEVGYSTEVIAGKKTAKFTMKKKPTGSSTVDPEVGKKYGSGGTVTPTATPAPTTSPVPTTPADPTTSNAPATSVDSFKDMLTGHDWAKESVDALVKAGIISGTSSTTYEPDRSITRAEFCKLIVTAFKFTDVDETKSYSDVKSSDWFYKFVLTAAKAGVVTGYTEGDFKPEASITREEMAAMLVRAFKSAGIAVPDSDMTFSDADEMGDWAVQYIAGLSKLGVVGGRGDNKFVPRDNLTRAESAKVIYSSLAFLTVLTDSAE